MPSSRHFIVEGSSSHGLPDLRSYAEHLANSPCDAHFGELKGNKSLQLAVVQLFLLSLTH